MTAALTQLWSTLSGSPLFHLTATLLAFQAADWLYRRAGMHPLLNPVLLSILMLGGLLAATGIDYATYFQGAQLVHFLLGPATVALAIPLYRQLSAIRRSALALLAGLLVGSLTAILAGVGIAWALGGDQKVLLALAPRSATTPIAMGIVEKLGGLPSLTAVFVITSGITGAVAGTWVLNLVRVRDQKARGFAAGLASHGIATARKLQLNETAGAFAGMAIGLNGLATAILVPILWGLLD